MIVDDEEDALASRFYDASCGVGSWEDTLGRLAHALRSDATMFVTHRPGTMSALEARSHNYPNEFLASFFAGEIYAHDPRMPAIASVPPGRTYFDELLYDVDEVGRDPWVRASTDTLGMSAQVGARLRLPEGGEASLCLLRRTRESDTLEARAAAMRRIAPRIEQALALGYLVERERETRWGLLECIAAKADAMLLLDPFFRPSFMNDAAERLLQSDDGLTLAGGTLRALRRPEDLTLRRLLVGCIEGDGGVRRGGRLLVSRRSRRKPYVLTAIAPPDREIFLTSHRLACLVHISDLAAPPVPAAADLRSVFGLSRRESELAAQLVRAPQLDIAAVRSGMAVNTARNHLQSIFSKTGAAGQAELVQLLGRIL
jgi:DNA-binding CsgD family transcriptional regulator